MTDAIGSFFRSILEFFYGFTGSYGLSIILLTVLFELILLPLNIKQTHQMNKMNELQPQIKELEKKYKKDPQKYNMEVAKLYQENHVNVFMGCLPMLIQLPILLALFYALRGMHFGEGFLFIKDLGAAPTGSESYILAALAAVTTFLSNKMTTNAQTSNANGSSMTAVMNIMMPLMMGWFTFQISAGVALYWIVRNIFAIIKQLVMNGPPDFLKFNKEKEGTK